MSSPGSACSWSVWVTADFGSEAASAHSNWTTTGAALASPAMNAVGRPHPLSNSAAAAATQCFGSSSAFTNVAIASTVWLRASSCTSSAALGLPPGFPLVPRANGRPRPRPRPRADTWLISTMPHGLRLLRVRRNHKIQCMNSLFALTVASRNWFSLAVAAFSAERRSRLVQPRIYSAGPVKPFRNFYIFLPVQVVQVVQ